MGSENLITWNVKNWITVFLMFMLGWAVLTVGMRYFAKDDGK